MSIKKGNVYYSLKFYVWGLLLVSLILSCSGKPKSFSEILVSLKKMPTPQKETIIKHFVLTHNFPVVEDSTAYFLFQDTTNQSVFLAGDFTQWRPDSIPLKRIRGTNYYYTSLTFPLNARLEYKFVVGKRWVLDPFNSFKEQGGLGRNSVLMMPAYHFSKNILLNIKYRVSALDAIVFKSKILKNKRNVYFYHHPKANTCSPLLIFNDGGDYLHFGKARIVLDNLIGKNKIVPINALFVDPVKRMKEYWLNDGYLSMMFGELIPQVEKKFNLNPKSLGFGGASLGGETALYALKNYGTRLNFIFSQSGSVWIEKEKLLDILQTLPRIGTKIYLSYGKFEGMAGSHARLVKILKQKNVNFKLYTFPEGHNWGNWRGHLDEMLTYFYRGQRE